MNVLILHGMDGKAGIHWQQWLQDELLKNGHNVIMPTLPGADHPDRKVWLDEVKGYMSKLPPEDTVIVAHSLSVPSALDYIEQSSKPIKALISVSGWSYVLDDEVDFFMVEKTLDFSKISNKIGKAYVLYGDNDPYVSQKALRDLANALGVEPMVFHNGGHLNTSAGYTRFPELLDIIKQL